MSGIIAAVGAGAAASIGGGLLAAGAQGDATEAAQQALSQARDIIGGVTVPTAEEMSVVYKQLQSAGVLTPELEQTLQQKTSVMNNVKVDQATIDAQKQSLQSLQELAKTGLTATDRAALAQAQGTMQQQNKADQGAIMQNMAARGMGGSGTELAARLAASQSGMQNAQAAGLQIGDTATRNALNAQLQSGQVAGQMNSQQFGQQAQIAQAQNAINQFNAQNAQQVAGYNTQLQNQTQQQNLANKQNIMNQNVGIYNQQQQANAAAKQQAYSDQMQKAMGMAGYGTQTANVLMQGGQQQANLYSGMGAGLGQAASSAANYGMMNNYLSSLGSKGTGTVPEVPSTDTGYWATNPYSKWEGGMVEGREVSEDHVPSNPLQQYGGGMIPGMLNGGEVPGEAQVPGDSPENDTVDAKLSPGEAVIPRSYMQNPDHARAFLEGLLKGHAAVKARKHAKV